MVSKYKINDTGLALNTHPHRFKEWYPFFFWVLLLTVSIITGLLVLEWTENRRFMDNQRRSIVEQLSTIRARLEGGLNAELLLARSIITQVAINTDITEEQFSMIAEHFMEASNHIRNIGLAKGTVLTYVYPVKGNEEAIGLDYLTIESQWPAVKRVIEGRQTIVAGPLKLVQGGIGIIGRTPIYIDSKGVGDGNGTYFGILSVVIDMPSLFEAAELIKKNGHLAIAIRGKDGLGAKGDVFYGSENLFEKNPVLTNIALPGGSWLMAATPASGWGMTSPLIVFYRLGALTVNLIIVALLFVQRLEMIRRKKIEMERKQLIRELKAALSQVKQLSGFLPICANCKKIRDDRGYWKQIEAYIRDHSEANFSHGICPDCAKELYPDITISDDDE